MCSAVFLIIIHYIIISDLFACVLLADPFLCVCVLCAFSQTAYNILKTHPQVNPDKIGLFGLSLGSIVSIQMAAESLVIKASHRLPISWRPSVCLNSKLFANWMTFSFCCRQNCGNHIMSLPHCE